MNALRNIRSFWRKKVWVCLHQNKQRTLKELFWDETTAKLKKKKKTSSPCRESRSYSRSISGWIMQVCSESNEQKGKKTSNLRLLNYTADCSVSVFRASVTSMEEISCRCEGGRVENGWRAEILSAQSLKKGESGDRTSCPCVVWCSMYTDGCVRHVFVAVVIASAENVLPLTSGLFFWLPFLRLSPSLLSPAWLCVFLFFL